MANQTTPAIQVKDSNVGIGTTSPSFKLDVNGNTRIGGNSGSARLNVGGAANEWVADFQASTTTNQSYGLVVRAGTSSTDFPFYVLDSSNSTSFFAIKGNGNVGIGTTAPEQKLHVAGNISIRGIEAGTYGSLRFGTSNSTYYDDWAGIDSDWEGVGINVSNLRFYTSYGSRSERMRITSSGNVLINTTTDSGYKLRVNGTTMIDSSLRLVGNMTVGSDTSQWSLTGVANGGAIWQKSHSGAGGSDDRYLRLGNVDNNGTPNYVLTIFNSNVGIGTTNPLSNLQITASEPAIRIVDTDDSSTSIIGSSSGYTYIRPFSRDFRVIDAAGVGLLTVKPNGNVLIGTTTDAGAKLRVYGGYMTVEGTNTAMYIESNYAGGNGLDAGTLISAGGTNSNIIIIPSGGGVAGSKVVGSAYNGSAWRSMLEYANVSSGEPVLSLVKTAGNVGIGTTAPYQSKLHVTKSESGATPTAVLRVGNQGAGYTSRIILTDETTNDANISYLGATQSLGFGLGTSLSQMVLTSTGNVGIGTTAPLAKIHVEGGGGNGTAWFGGTAIASHFNFSTDEHTYIRGGKLTSSVYIADNNTGNVFIANGGGNVGIGTTSPSYKLDVSGSARVNSTSNLAMFVKTNSAFGAAISYEDSTTGGNDVVSAGAIGGAFYIGTNFSEKMRVSSAGNVIIGSTTDAGYKLDVHGEILGRDDIRILNTYALILNGTDANWRIGRNTITDSGWLTGNTMQMVVFGGQTGQGFQVVNTNGTALFEIDGVAGASRFTNALGVGVNPSGTAGRIDASNDIVAYSTSDQRLKENITPIANALDKVKALTGVEFDWKEETKAVHGYEGHDVGVIAQEVQAVLPEAVRTNDSGYLSVRYEKMIGLLVEAMKEQQNQIDELKAKLDGLTK